jgi:replicative DNA helicase
VLALAQIPKPDKKNMNRRPTKHDYRESGALEEKCDVGLMIYRELDDHDQPTGYDEVIVAKQRNGPIGICPVTLLPGPLVYADREWPR